MQYSEIQFFFLCHLTEMSSKNALPNKMRGYVGGVSESSDLKSLAVKSVEVQEGRDWRGASGLSLSCKYGSKVSVRREACEVPSR